MKYVKFAFVAVIIGLLSVVLYTSRKCMCNVCTDTFCKVCTCKDRNCGDSVCPSPRQNLRDQRQ